MIADVVPALRCPLCAADGQLTLNTTKASGEFVMTGSLLCNNCGASTSIRNGIWNAMGNNRPPRTLAMLVNVLPPLAYVYESVWRKGSVTLMSGRPFPLEEEFDEMLSAVGAPSGSDLASPLAVDVGCSEGLYARTLADHGYTVLAVDYSARFLKRVVVRRKNRRVIPVRAMAQALPVSTDAATTVVLGGTLNDIGDRQPALNEISRVCAADGSFFSMSLVAATRPFRRLRQHVLSVSGVAFPTLLQTRSAFERAGFTVAKVEVDQIVARLSGKPRNYTGHP